MNKKLSACCLVLVIKLFLSGAVIAQEDEQCDKGISYLDIRGYEILAQDEISDLDVAAYRQLLAGCAAMYQSFSPGKRDEFLRLLDTLMKRMDDLYLKVSSEGLYRPDGPTRSSLRRTQQINALKGTLQKLYISLLSQRSPLDKGWGDTFVSNLFIGYENIDVDGFERYGGGRAGLNFYQQTEVSLSDEGMTALHVFGEAMLTNTAEHTVGGIDDAYEVDANLFLPYPLDSNSQGRWMIGPVVGAKLKKLDDISDSRWKHMVGMRFALSPDLYIDGRYGKSEGVSGNRVEVRAQLPVAAVFNGDVIVGGIVNMSSDDNVTGGDSMLMYLLWQVNFLDVLNIY